MTNLFSKLISAVTSIFGTLQVKRFLAMALVGVLLLTTNVDPNRNAQATINKIDQTLNQSNSDRPKTTGEWNAEAQEDANLGDRVKQIGKESAEAVKDFGKMYPDTAERSGEALKDQTGN